ncbi:unnamed protein product [Toxocara canis]|uniref:Uncharacterized protein n=1 Tax=Toxocara canis TaxID=6265 RepID=A0A183U8I9_TOXCA|nr:unnamed protein product [Toxocara canis]
MPPCLRHFGSSGAPTSKGASDSMFSTSHNLILYSGAPELREGFGRAQRWSRVQATSSVTTGERDRVHEFALKIKR